MGEACDRDSDCEHKGAICLRGTCQCHPFYVKMASEKGKSARCVRCKTFAIQMKNSCPFSAGDDRRRMLKQMPRATVLSQWEVPMCAARIDIHPQRRMRDGFSRRRPLLAPLRLYGAILGVRQPPMRLHIGHSPTRVAVRRHEQLPARRLGRRRLHSTRYHRPGWIDHLSFCDLCFSDIQLRRIPRQLSARLFLCDNAGFSQRFLLSESMPFGQQRRQFIQLSSSWDVSFALEHFVDPQTVSLRNPLLPLPIGRHLCTSGLL